MQLYLFLSSLYLGTFSFIIAARQDNVHLKDNGYEGIIIGIHKDVPYDPALIQNIKDYFIEASDYLLTATRYRAYFRNITLVIPLTWPKSPDYEAPTGESYEAAHVRVGESNPAYGDNPYVLQKGGCGEPGEYMHLTPDYILNRKQTTYRWGKPAKSVVHEWAHLRWGVFDEYAKVANGDKHFYAKGNRILPVRCNDKIEGRPVIPSSQKRCKIDRQTMQVEEECRFVPKLDSSAAKSSIMFMQFLKAVTEFCDDGTLKDENIIHNKDSPNPQNRLCNGKSAWEVMREHRDFGNGANPQNKGLDGTSTTFRLVQLSNRRTVMVLDVSGSMDDSPRWLKMTLLRQASRKYILYAVESGSQLGIVEFSSDASEKQSLLEVTDEPSRTAMLKNIPNDPIGETCIGCGLYKAIDLLTRNGKKCEGNILLITDGFETRWPANDDKYHGVSDKVSTAKFNYLEDITKNIQCKIVVDSIAITNKASTILGELSKSTGGRSFFYDTTSTTSLMDAFDTIAAERGPLSMEVPHITLESTLVNIMAANGTVSGNFVIDKAMGNRTVLTFAYNKDITVRVLRPDGVELDSSYLNEDIVFKTFTVTIPGLAQNGVWTYYIDKKENKNTIVNVNIMSKPPAGADPITVRSFADLENVVFSGSSVVRIFAHVTQGDTAPILGALVDADVGRPSERNINVKLRDNGSGLDVIANDGIYTGTFPATLFTGNGRYSIKTNVRSDQSDKKATVYSFVSEGAAGIPQHSSEATYKPTDLGDFQRVGNGGEFRVTDYVDGLADHIPPARITDLEVTEIKPSEGSVKIKWTSVGDDYEHGTASRNEIYFFSNMTSNSDLSRYTPITQNAIYKGDLEKPIEAGLNEQYTINMNGFPKLPVYFMVVRSIDAIGNQGMMSNYAAFSIEEPDLGTEFEYEAEHATDNTGAIVAGVICSLILVAVIIFLIILYLSKKSDGKLWKLVSPDKKKYEPSTSKENIC